MHSEFTFLFYSRYDLIYGSNDVLSKLFNWASFFLSQHTGLLLKYFRFHLMLFLDQVMTDASLLAVFYCPQFCHSLLSLFYLKALKVVHLSHPYQIPNTKHPPE